MGKQTQLVRMVEYVEVKGKFRDINLVRRFISEMYIGEKKIRHRLGLVLDYSA